MVGLQRRFWTSGSLSCLEVLAQAHRIWETHTAKPSRKRKGIKRGPQHPGLRPIRIQLPHVWMLCNSVCLCASQVFRLCRIVYLAFEWNFRSGWRVRAFSLWQGRPLWVATKKQRIGAYARSAFDIFKRRAMAEGGQSGKFTGAPSSSSSS